MEGGNQIMSIDERIVSMVFDNKRFESGVQTTIKSIDRLKEGLNLDASANICDLSICAAFNFTSRSA